MLRIVDISGHQGDKGIDPGALDCDGVIVKVTGGDYFTNPYWRQHADRVLETGKLLGLYHYARDSHGGYATPETEARRFLDAIKPYVGNCLVALDWESEADAYPITWAAEWCGIVERETGATPMMYVGGLDANNKDFSPVAKYPLWLASYLYKYRDSGWVDAPDCIYGSGSWPRITMYQYTSTGRIGGFWDSLDLSVFYGSRAEWAALAKSRQVADLQPISNAGGAVYRLYNWSMGDHLYTSSIGERDALMKTGWVLEGEAFKAPIGTVPVFRLFNSGTSDHMWTASFEEAEDLQKAGWIYEGVPFFASGDPGATDVYRLFNPNDGDHFWTASKGERDELSGLGWKYEGVAFRM